MPDYRHSRQDHTVSHTWFTSDLHIGHKLVARHRSVDVNFFSPGRSREVSDEFVAAWHDGMLSENWDAHVGRDDIVWVLGDISAGGSNAQRNALQWITQRPGRKRLVSGNHDGCHPMHRNSHNWLREYLKAFESVQSAARIRINGHSVLLSHFPYRDDHTEVPRFDQWRLRNLGELLLHGHTHSAERVHGRELHIGVDAWGMKPVAVQTIIERIEAMSDGTTDAENRLRRNPGTIRMMEAAEANIDQAAEVTIGEGEIPDRTFTDDRGHLWEWCGGQPGTWAWRRTAILDGTTE